MPNHDHPDIELIWEALRGELPASEKEALNQRRGSEPDFEARYRAIELEFAILKAAERASLKHDLQQQVAHSPARSIPLWVWPTAIAASLLALFLVFRPTNSSIQELAVGYIQPVSSGQIRGEAAAGPGLSAYRQQQWETAIEIWSQADTLSFNETLLLGSALMQTGAYQPAEEVFGSLLLEPPYQDIASWNLCLAWILNGQPEKARPLLKEIAGSSHYQKQGAFLLLESFR